MAEYSKNKTMKFTFHVLGVPHTKTTKTYVACAFTQKVYKFCKMMTERGHTVIHYGTEGSNPICTENVNVLPDEIWQEVYGEFQYKKKFFQFDQQDKAYQTFFKNAVKEIRKRKGENEFLLPFWGRGVKWICDELENELIVVEPGIGYSSGAWAKFRVFESYAIMHNHFSLEQVRWALKMNWYDRVIPNYFDLEDFEFNDKKENYFLFLGRVFNGKGIHIAIDICQRLGVKLKIAGQLGDSFLHLEKNEDPLLEYVGYAKTEERKELMKNAMGFICPSMYAEPFCGTQVEAMLSGTPVISTDWGAFTEINVHGKTGYRCRTFDDFMQAAKKCMNKEIDYKECREWAEQYSLENVAEMYEKYFKDVHNVYAAGGWYELS